MNGGAWVTGIGLGGLFTFVPQESSCLRPTGKEDAKYFNNAGEEENGALRHGSFFLLGHKTK